jgi:hypothetical protein
VGPRARSEKQHQARGRRRAKWTVRALTAVCALAAIGVGVSQLTTEGFQAFVDRPAGVGATPDDQPAVQRTPRPLNQPSAPELVPGLPERPPVVDQPFDSYDTPPIEVPTPPRPFDDGPRHGPRRPRGEQRV